MKRGKVKIKVMFSLGTRHGDTSTNGVVTPCILNEGLDGDEWLTSRFFRRSLRESALDFHFDTRLGVGLITSITREKEFLTEVTESIIYCAGSREHL